MTSKTKWFCRDCWRHGVAETADLKLCQSEHDQDVRDDMQAYKIVAGMDAKFRNSTLALKFPGVDCKGCVTIGERQGKPRYEKPALPQLEFSGDPIEQVMRK